MVSGCGNPLTFHLLTRPSQSFGADIPTTGYDTTDV